jgi:acetyl-CoA C-acetyltransferase/acetyl-CoA acyltransferase
VNVPTVIAAGIRTPQVKAGGAFAREDAGHLGAFALRELLARANVDGNELDHVFAGCVGPPHDQANVARVIALRAGVGVHVPALTVGRNCASGLEAVHQACLRIEAGRGDLFACVGVEVMSAYPLIFGPHMTETFARLNRARTGSEKLAALARFRPAHLAPRVALMEGLTDPVCGLIMGKTAEVLAREFGIDRAAGDLYALESHARAKAARDAGRFAREIAPLLPLGGSGTTRVEHDDSIRDQQTLEALAKLPPYFERPDGVVSVGNACGISDGATALLVCSAARARALGLSPLAGIRSLEWAGLAPERMGLGPVFASARALQDAGAELADMGAIEINEAFAHQVLACAVAFASDTFARDELGLARALGELDPARTNANGGAIALGHPVGATGARLLLTLAHQLVISDCELGLATLCIGGGQGGACVLERV